MSVESILSRVASFCRDRVPPQSDILVAVSGGCDSVALYCILRELRNDLRLGRLDIVHVNHGLRGEESDADECLVHAMAEKTGASLFREQLSGKSSGDPGLENWARQLRYRFLLSTKSRHGYTFVATGHTADDQAETVMMRMIRGSGLRGLAGIHALREDGVLRPLLSVRKDEVLAYLKSLGHAYRSDSSNNNLRIRRNWVRHALMPVVVKRQHDAVERMAELALMTQKHLQALAPIINKWIDTHVISTADVDRFSVRREGLAGGWIACEALAELLRKRGIPFSRYHIDRLSRSDCREGSAMLLPRGWQARVAATDVVFVRAPADLGESSEPFCFDISVPGVSRCGTVATFATEFVSRKGGDCRVRSTDNLSVCLAADSGLVELRFRSYQSGEMFWPLGAGAPVTVHAFLKKQGVSRYRRAKTGVVAGPDGLIVWIPGLRVSQNCRVSDQTKTILRASCEFH